MLIIGEIAQGRGLGRYMGTICVSVLSDHFLFNKKCSKTVSQRENRKVGREKGKDGRNGKERKEKI